MIKTELTMISDMVVSLILFEIAAENNMIKSILDTIQRYLVD